MTIDEEMEGVQDKVTSCESVERRQGIAMLIRRSPSSKPKGQGDMKVEQRH
jgi:hypothetical protein